MWLPEFRLETYFSRWELTARHNLAASDLLRPGDAVRGRAAGARRRRGRTRPPRPAAGLHQDVRRPGAAGPAVAGTYERVDAGDVICLTGAEEGIFLVLHALLDAVRDALRPTTRVVAVNFPNNPTGAVIADADMRALVALCDERGIHLFSDEVYGGVERDRTGCAAGSVPPGSVPPVAGPAVAGRR